MKITAQDFIGRYSMLMHPEGGYYKETWRSAEQVSTKNLSFFEGDVQRSLMTSILFLLPGFTFSALHKIKSEELWNYHYGDPIVIYEIIDGQWTETILGPENGQVLQHVVQPNTWFASRCVDPDGFGLCGCSVVPGFDFADFEMAGEKELSSQFPHLKEKIRMLTRIP